MSPMQAHMQLCYPGICLCKSTRMCLLCVHFAAQMGGAAKFEDAKRPKPWIVQDPCGTGAEGALY